MIWLGNLGLYTNVALFVCSKLVYKLHMYEWWWEAEL